MDRSFVNGDHSGNQHGLCLEAGGVRGCLVPIGAEQRYRARLVAVRFADDVTNTDSANVGRVSLVATQLGVDIAFSNTAATFNALTANAGTGVGDRIDVDASVTTDTDTLVLAAETVDAGVDEPAADA